MHVQTGGSTLTYQQPEVNLIRGAVQALAAAVAGTQSMAVSCYDEAFSIPSEKAQTLSLRTQQVIAHETGVTNTVDPLAGSYYVESLTDELERRTYAWIADIDARGGAITCAEDGTFERIISDAACALQQEIFSRQRIVVGVNAYRMEDEDYDLETFRVDDASEEEQLRRLRAFRASRDDGAAQRSLDEVRAAAERNDNTMPAVLEAITNRATQGEIIAALIDVFGAFRAPAIY
jgi:methylmalonyl-CoA mutase, N-terminal domain